MADYWKSYEKKYCEFCRCWFVNNKACVQFHESGQKHKDNVQKRVDQLRRKKTQEDKDKLNERLTVLRVEHAARASMQKDAKFAGGSAKQLRNELNKISHERINEDIHEKASRTSWTEIINVKGQKCYRNKSSGEVTFSVPLIYLTLEEHGIAFPELPSNDASVQFVHHSSKRRHKSKKDKDSVKDKDSAKDKDFAEVERIIELHREMKEEALAADVAVNCNKKQNNSIYGDWELVRKKKKVEELPAEIVYTAKHTPGSQGTVPNPAPVEDKFIVEFEEQKPIKLSRPSGKTVEFKTRKSSNGRNIKQREH